MRLTRASHYALIALTHMAQQPEPTKTAVASHEIATARNIPMRFLLKVNIPNETGNKAARAGMLGETIKRILDEQKPEAVYFSDDRGQRIDNCGQQII